MNSTNALLILNQYHPSVMHLVALKHTLTFVDLAWNDAITDDSIPSLCTLGQLEILSVKGTNITIAGLSKIAWYIKQHDGERRISLIVPTECEEYLYGMYQHILNKLSTVKHINRHAQSLRTSIACSFCNGGSTSSSTYAGRGQTQLRGTCKE